MFGEGNSGGSADVTVPLFPQGWPVIFESKLGTIDGIFDVDVRGEHG